MPRPGKTIGHLFYGTSSFVHHFIAISEFKLGLQSGNIQFGSKLANFCPVWPWSLTDNLEKLDESKARWQLKSPRSLSGRSIHLTLVTKWSWSWSWLIYCHPLCAKSIGLPILRYSYFKIWPWKSMVKVMCVVKGQGHVGPLKFKGQGQTHWSHLRPGIQSICLLFVSWQSDHFWLRYSKFYIWPWKFKVKVMAKVKPDGHIWALEFNRYVCFSFHGNRTVFGRDIANSIFDLEKSRSRSWPKSTKIYSSNLQVRANNHTKNERNPKSCSKVIAWTRICGRRRRTNRYMNIKLPLVYQGG